MNQPARYTPVGDRALSVQFGIVIRLDVNRRVHAFEHAISQTKILGVEECVPAYGSLLVYYDPSKTSYEQLVFCLRDVETKLREISISTPKRAIEVPVVYGSTYGPDLEYVARYHKLDEEEVVRLHSSKEYTVYMIGFVAGFPYLGEVDAEIATPRLKTPRLRVPAGSVGIAERQTGIYPCESPGGWQIIGRTPLKFFDVNKLPPASIQPGDTVKFKPIEEREFEEAKERPK